MNIYIRIHENIFRKKTYSKINREKKTTQTSSVMDKTRFIFYQSLCNNVVKF